MSGEPDVKEYRRRVAELEAAWNVAEDRRLSAERRAEAAEAKIAAVREVRAKVLDPAQMVTEGPLIGRIKVAEWIDRALDAPTVGRDETLVATDPQAVLDALTRAGVLTKEWALRFEKDLSTPTMDGQTESTQTMVMPRDRVDGAIAAKAPIGGGNRRAVSRLVTVWREASA